MLMYVYSRTTVFSLPFVYDEAGRVLAAQRRWQSVGSIQWSAIPVHVRCSSHGHWLCGKLATNLVEIIE